MDCLQDKIEEFLDWARAAGVRIVTLWLLSTGNLSRDPTELSFSMAHYFLGYDYLNMGLYNKSNLSFRKFMELSEKENIEERSKEIFKYRAEVGELTERLRDPCQIEEGCNEVIRGRFKEGLKVLALYEENEAYSKWWPMYFYLEITKKELGLWKAAESTLKRVLKLNPVHKK